MASQSEGFPLDKNEHDGAMRCLLCHRVSRDADYEWCLVSLSLVCDDCCAALVTGDTRLLLEAMSRNEALVTPLHLIRTCAACQRITRRLLEDEFGDFIDDGPSH